VYFFDIPLVIQVTSAWLQMERSTFLYMVDYYAGRTITFMPSNHTDIKQNLNATIKKYKALLAAKGFKQYNNMGLTS